MFKLARDNVSMSYELGTYVDLTYLNKTQPEPKQTVARRLWDIGSRVLFVKDLDPETQVINFTMQIA